MIVFYDKYSKSDKVMAKFKNEDKFEHRSRGGTNFRADRCDFVGGVSVIVPAGLSREQLLADVSEMIAFHVLNIRNELNGFSGYDCINYRFSSPNKGPIGFQGSVRPDNGNHRQ